MFTKTLSRVLVALILLAGICLPASAETKLPHKFAKSNTSPLAALQAAAKLIDQKSTPVIAQPELDIFKKVAAGHADQCSTTDTLLVASGIIDPQKRKKYADKINKIVDSAGKAIADSDTLNDKADALAKYLRKHPLHGGGVPGQVDMARLLDKGTFNCVSSAALYYTVGQRLGINTRADDLPGHVFLQMGDLCIEPTGGYTRTVADHKGDVDDCWKDAEASDKEIYGANRYHQSGGMGLIGAIYYDHATGKDPFDLRTAYALKACCLSPNHPLFTHQAAAMLYSWALDASNHHNFTKAKKIATIYDQLFGSTWSRPLFKQIAAVQ